MLPVWLLLAFTPAELSPTVVDLDAAFVQLRSLVVAASATGAATVQLQAEWTRVATKKGPCDDHDRLALGWRIERFGAAWREAAQAARAQAVRVGELRVSQTVAPLVDERRREEITVLVAQSDAAASAFLQASAWEVAYVRPVLAACPIAGVGLDLGVSAAPIVARQDPDWPVAVLAMGDGFVCPAKERADEAVILVVGGQACWAPDATCACEPVPLSPGAVLGPPLVEGTATPSGG